MIKKLMVFFVVAMAAIGAWAETWTDSKTGYTWTYSVKGRGVEIYNYGSAAVSPKPTSSITIPSEIGGYQVVEIGSGAFYNCSSLTGVIIPSTVTSVGASAFYGCGALKSVIIPASVTSIGTSAFQGCGALEGVTIPVSVQSIGYRAFKNCIGLKSVSIPVSISKIEDETFYGCISLAEVNLPVTVKTIDSYAFYGCSALKTLNIPYGVEEIFNNAFYGCGSLPAVTFPASLKTIGSSSFYGCSSLTTVDIPSNVNSVGYDAFEACGNLRNVSMPGTLSSSYVFGDSCKTVTNLTIVDSSSSSMPYISDFPALTTLSLPASLKRIYNSDISHCSSLTTISVAAGNPYYKVSGGLLLTKDGSEIVAVPKGRTWVDIPDSVTSIPSGIFSGCQHLYAEHSIPGLRIVDGWVVGCDWDYEEGPRPPSILNLTGVCGIADEAFYGCEGLKNVVIGEGVRTIGSYAFDDCYDLESISISSSVRTIGKYAFDDCFRLKSITVASGNAAYEFTGGLLISKDKTQLVAVSREVSTVKIPEGVREIPDGFFAGCNKLTSVSIPSSIDEYGIGDEGSVFSSRRYDEVTDEWYGETIGCPNLKTITVASGNPYYKSIGGMLCSVYDDEMYLEAVPQALTSVTIPEGVTDVDSETFEGCAKLNTIKVASGNRNYKSVNGLLLTKDGKKLVWVPNALTSVTIPDGVVDLGRAFGGCEKLTSVKIPDSVVAVARSTFSECPESLFDKKTIPGCIMVDGWIVGVTDEAYERYGENGEEWNLDLTKARGIAERAFTRYQPNVCNGGTGISGLHSIVIPKNIIAVGDRAFYRCGNLSSVTIESGVRHIAASAFVECHESLYDDTTLPGFRLVDGWLIHRKYYYDDSIKSLDLTGLRGVAGRQDVNFCCGMSGSLFACGVTNLVVGDGVTAISHGAFANSQELEEVEIADSVTFIGENAFLYCRNLKRVKMPDSLRGKVPTSAFSQCSPGLRIEYYKPIFTVEFDANYPGVSVVSGTLNQDGEWERYITVTVHRGEEHTFWITGANSNAWISLDVYGEYYYVEHGGDDYGRDVVYPSESMYIENSKGGEDVYMLLTAEDWNSVPEYVKSITFYVEVYGSYDEAYPANRKFTFGHASGRYMYPSPSNPDYVGDMTESRLVESGEAVGWLPTLALENHGFRGWYDKLEGGAKISETTKVLVNTTYYAHWTSLLSAKALEGCEGCGTVTGSGFYASGETAVLKAIPENGFLFAGWIGLIDETVDLKNPTLKYVMKNRSVVVEAEFISVEDDWVDVWMDCSNEYVTNEEISDIYIGVDSGSLATLKVAGLPTGLKYTAKPVYDRNGELLHEANTIYGTPTKSGVYTVTVTATTAGKKTAACSQTVIVRKSGEKVVVVDCDANGGKVTGGGVYAEGKNVSLKATANKGYVFAGWYEDEGFTMPCDSTLIDYRNPSYAYMMGANDKTFYARFEPVAADTNLNLTVGGVAITPEDTPLKSFTVGSATNLPLVIDSLSLPKAAVKGLPAGMKFTDKPVYKKGSKTEIEVPANTIYGTPTKPRVYKVSVSLTNTSIKKAIVNDFEIVVPNLTDALVPVEDGYGPYVPGVAYTNTIVVAADCAVSGLPAGMKWTAKDILDNKTKQVVVPANSAYGTPTKPGKYTVYFTKTIDKVKHTATATFIVGEFPIVNVVTIGSGTGKVTGAGAFAANKKVTLKATADTKDDAKKGTKKSVFAGWYYSRTDGSSVQDMNAQAARSTSTTDGSPVDEENLVPVGSTVDFRTASLPYVMTAAPTTTLYAMFVTAEEDSDIALYVDGNEITSNATDNNFVAEGTTILPLEMESISIPKAAVSGLPAGMKYTDKALTVKATKTEEAYDVPANAIYGTPTKPGLYTVTVKLTNTTIKKAIEKTFTIEVPNFTAANGYFVDNLDNGIGKKRVLSVGITNIDDFLPSLALNSVTAKLAVSGLPSGLKYDAKTGKITGIATKPGTYTVTLTVTEGKAKYVSTITIEVEALPDWVVGTFYGKEIARGTGYYEWVCPMQITVTISAVGKISIKGIEPGESGTSRSAQLTEVRDDGSYAFTVHHVSGRKGNDGYTEGDLEGVITPMVYGDNVEFGCCIIHDVGVCDEDDDPYESDGEAYQSLYSSKSHVSKLPAFVRNAVTTVNMNYMRDDDWDSYYGGYLTLKYGANGAVTTAYSETEGGKATATGSAQLVPYEVDGNITKAWLYTALKPKGRDSFGVLLFLSIDTSNGNVYGEDVVIDDYLLEVDE